MCNVWRGDKSAFIVELAVEDWEALGKQQAKSSSRRKPAAAGLRFDDAFCTGGPCCRARAWGDPFLSLTFSLGRAFLGAVR
jgi:hypothetical protein